MEIWKDIIGYEGLYKISSLGNVKSLDRYYFNRYKEILIKGKKIKPFITNNYYAINLHKNGKGKTRYIHRLVAEHFIPKENNKPYVNHKNENKLDNRVANLEWCSPAYNINYGNCRKKISISNSTPVVQFDKNGKVLNTFYGMNEASRLTGISSAAICKCCKGIIKKTHGYIFKYLRGNYE